MNYKEFEKNVKYKLSEHEAQVDTDALVTAIFEKQKKAKRVPVWWGYGGTLIVAALITTLFFFYPGMEDASQPNVAVGNPAITPKHPSLSYDEIYDRIPEGDDNNEAAPVMRTKLKVTPNAAELKIRPDKVNFHNKNISKIGGVSRVAGQGSSIRATDVNNARTTPNDEFIENQKLFTIDNQSKDLASGSKVLKGVTDICFLTSREVGLNSPVMTAIDLGPGVKCPTFKPKKKIGLALIPEVGVFYPLANFKNEAGPESQPFAMRENKERSLEGLQAALYGKLYLSNSPWYFKTGVNYGRITRQMTYNDTYIQRDTTIGIIAITESQNHDTLTIIKGPIVTETTISKYEKRHYYHHLLSIPVVIGFQKKFDWIYFGIEAGVNINLISDQTGYVMVTPNQFGLVRDANLYRKRTGLSYLASIQIGVPMYNDNILALAVRANINPNNFALDNVPFNEKYQMLGVHLMYEIRF